MGKDEINNPEEYEDRRLEVCVRASEWAEHARAFSEDDPCDDGRAGAICGNRKDEDPCPS